MARKWQIEMWETLSAILGGYGDKKGYIADGKLSGEIRIAESGVADPITEAEMKQNRTHQEA